MAMDPFCTNNHNDVHFAFWDVGAHCNSLIMFEILYFVYRIDIMEGKNWNTLWSMYMLNTDYQFTYRNIYDNELDVDYIEM